MPRHSPRHRKQIFGAKHGPDEQVRSQRRACRHDAREHDTRKQRQKRDVAGPSCLFRLPRSYAFNCRLRERLQMCVLGFDPAPFRFSSRCVDIRGLGPTKRAEQADTCNAPVHGPRPVGEEDEEPHSQDVVSVYPVVGVGEIDTGNAVVEAEGEEGRLAKQERG